MGNLKDFYYSKSHDYSVGSNKVKFNDVEYDYTELIDTGETPLTVNRGDLVFLFTAYLSDVKILSRYRDNWGYEHYSWN